MRYLTPLLLCAVGLGILLDVRAHVKLSAAIADQGDRLGALRGDLAGVVGQVRRLEAEQVFRPERSAPPCQAADTTRSGRNAQATESATAEKAPPPREVDWSAYERARAILDRGVSSGSWTQEDADEFRLAASAAGGEKMMELMNMKIAALNAQKIHGRFVP